MNLPDAISHSELPQQIALLSRQKRDCLSRYHEDGDKLELLLAKALETGIDLMDNELRRLEILEEEDRLAAEEIKDQNDAG